MEMPSENRFRFRGAGILAAIVITGETLPAFSHEAQHIVEPHLPEVSFVYQYQNSPVTAVSGLSGTVVAFAKRPFG